MNTTLYPKRRAALLKHLPDNSIALIPSSPVKMRTETAEYAYRQHNDFYYLTGFTEKNALLVLIAGHEPQTLLFCEPKDPEKECWEGERLGPEKAAQTLGFSQAYAYSTCAEILPSLLKHKILYANLETLNTLSWLKKILNNMHLKTSETISPIIAEMRLFKSSEELTLMQKAADISVQAHQAGMCSVQPGQYEYQLAALYEFIFAKNGARAPAYNSIVGGGKNACTLHYVKNSDQFVAGDLVLVDAAAEYEGYAADITRTFPVSGKFTGPQRDLYDIVLAAQAHAIAEMKPGSGFKRMQDAAVQTLTQGLLDLGILKGTLTENIEQKTYRTYYMHSAGHWLGLDVHDVGSYQQQDQPRLFEPNMVMTIEPGLYMSPNEHLDKKWWNIGIRIEDDVCITETGCDVLSKALVKSVDDIEHLMRERPFEYAL
jgi:Xaa-Pro aminopeptidase